jgi:hypothetical protein
MDPSRPPSRRTDPARSGHLPNALFAICIQFNTVELKQARTRDRILRPSRSGVVGRIHHVQYPRPPDYLNTCTEFLESEAV